MSEIKLVLYKDNSSPRSLTINDRFLYRILFASITLGIATLLILAASVKLFVTSRATHSQEHLPSANSAGQDGGPSNSPEEQNKFLKDQIDLLQTKINNAALAQNAAKEIDKKNPALALFSPIVVDHTKEPAKIMIANFRVSKGGPGSKNPTTLSFDLSNAHPSETTEKGYIVVLLRNDSHLAAYPSVFTKENPYLLDFEKGETFQVARFRVVNATFDAVGDKFQILIFSRKGELLINTLYSTAQAEAKK